MAEFCFYVVKWPEKSDIWGKTDGFMLNKKSVIKFELIFQEFFYSFQAILLHKNKNPP